MDHVKKKSIHELSCVENVYELENINGPVLMIDNAAIVRASTVMEKVDEISILFH